MSDQQHPIDEHGIDGGFYDNMAHLAKGRLTPRLMCLCGYTTSPSCDTWEEAGADLDEHLEEVPAPQSQAKGDG